MYITDILNNLPKSDNTLAKKIAKKTEERRIKERIESFISSVLSYLGEESEYIQKGLSYSIQPISKISEEDKKELTNILVSEIKSVPDKLRSEINKFLSDSETETDDKKETEVEVSVSQVKTPELFGY